MAEKSRMNLDWSKQYVYIFVRLKFLKKKNLKFFIFRCLDAQNWNLEQALTIFVEAKEQGKIPPEAFISV